MRARTASRVDANQKEVVQGLRALPGVSVAVTSALGDGFPDIVVGYAGESYLFEIKNPANPPSKRRLTPDEQAFFDAWKGHIAKVETVAEILKWIDFPG